MLSIDKFKKEQKIAYKTLFNSFSNGHKSHAYLVSGDKDSYVKDVALIMAKSFVCDDDVLCCDKCRSCKRIEDKSYCDFKFINEEEKSVVVSDIESLRDEFALTAMEPKGIRVYIIHLIEQANKVAVNKLLKFLEEPNDDVFAILTTKNLSQVLPTIVSRCQLIRISSPFKEELYEKLLNDGVDEKDALILSEYTSNYDEAREFYDTSYNDIKEASKNALDTLLNSKDGLGYFVQRNVEEKFKNKKDIKLFLDIFGLSVKELILKNDSNNDNAYLEKVLAKILIAEGKINYNININLMLDSLVYDIVYKKEK